MQGDGQSIKSACLLFSECAIDGLPIRLIDEIDEDLALVGFGLLKVGQQGCPVLNPGCLISKALVFVDRQVLEAVAASGEAPLHRLLKDWVQHSSFLSLGILSICMLLHT